jgi:hypothetical protein
VVYSFITSVLLFVVYVFLGADYFRVEERNECQPPFLLCSVIVCRSSENASLSKWRLPWHPYCDAECTALKFNHKNGSHPAEFGGFAFHRHTAHTHSFVTGHRTVHSRRFQGRRPRSTHDYRERIPLTRGLYPGSGSPSSKSYSVNPKRLDYSLLALSGTVLPGTVGITGIHFGWARLLTLTL